MYAINRTTIRDTYKDDDRIHNLEVDSEHLEFIKEAELFVEENSPLPSTFDVSPCQNPYFSEYTYSDFSKAFWVKSLSNEFNTRYLMTMRKDLKEELKFSEKYLLQENKSETSKRIILFLAGTNLFDYHAWEIVDRVMYLNDKALIKTHPLTKDETLKWLGHRYGWHRILGPRDSGYGWYNRADRVYATANSELMVRSLIDNKFMDCLTKFSLLGKSSYMPFLIMHNNNYSSDEIKSSILDENSGFIFCHQKDWKKRITNYFQKTMDMRDEFIAHTPFFVGNTDKT